tara:strand:+ start:646 stop:1377 length:732 start_codon:yes stop_codon:yes gene_type:complete
MSKKITILTPLKNNFSNNYLAVRDKENRVLTNDEVLQLPHLQAKNPNAKEWEARVSSTKRIITYLKNQTKPLDILDIGCGNGWFTHKLAQIKNTQVTGIDINLEELEQANTVFNLENLEFVYGDIFQLQTLYAHKFDIITLNASVQYFENLEKLVVLLNSFLKENGEIHVMDSPFYSKNEIENAKKRTIDYYSSQGFPEMANYYFHHSLEDLNNYKIIHKPNRINRFITKNPFMHILLKKDSL